MKSFLKMICLSIACVVAASPTLSGPKRSGYDNFSSPNRHQFSMVTAPHPVRYGRRSERYELRQGDCGHDDCGNHRLRSELALRANKVRARFNKDIWYGWSFYNQSIPSFSSNEIIWPTFGQWKMGGPTFSIISLIQQNRGNRNWRRCSARFCAKNLADPNGDVYLNMEDIAKVVPKDASTNWLNVCRLFSMSENRGKWVDIVINTNFSTGGDGYVFVWINGQKRCEYHGVVVVERNHTYYRGPNHRRGIFVRNTENWEAAHPGIAIPTLIAYFDEFRVGKSRQEVDIRMIEARGGRAVD